MPETSALRVVWFCDFKKQPVSLLERIFWRPRISWLNIGIYRLACLVFVHRVSYPRNCVAWVFFPRFSWAVLHCFAGCTVRALVLEVIQQRHDPRRRFAHGDSKICATACFAHNPTNVGKSSMFAKFAKCCQISNLLYVAKFWRARSRPYRSRCLKV